LRLIEENGQDAPDIYNLPHDEEVYRYFGNGWNGDVFQFGTASLSDYTRSMKPRNIGDLIAANALYRPGPMENNFHNIYVKCKNEGRKEEYFWGTKDITKDTYGLLVYQEQIMQIFRDLGGLSLKEADDVRRAIGKKKMDVIKAWKERVEQSFLDKGATPTEFLELWEAIIEFAKYSFNKSHSTAYALTGYISQYLKVNYPIEYWTVALDYAGENETLTFLSEIIQSKRIKIQAPDINKSRMQMHSSQENSTIYWGLGSIKGIGEDTAFQVINERDANGFYKSFADFYSRHNFKGSKVKKQTYEALVTAGAFDDLYGFGGAEYKRHSLIKRYRAHAKKKPSNPLRDIYTIGQLHEQWWWNLQQKKLTGLANIDYEQIALEKGIETPFCTMLEFNGQQRKAIKRSFGGYILEVKVGRSKKGAYARLTIEHNYKLTKLLIWAEQYDVFKEQLKGSEKRLIIFEGDLKYDGNWSKANQFTLQSDSKLIVL
jgi:DNA polymerase-3 subunit alpha